MVSAASLSASRRHRRASRSPAPTRNAANASTEQLLMEQNKLLLELLKILQLQQQQQPSASSAGSDGFFCEGNQILQVFQSFEQETKHLLSAWHTQKSIFEKYHAGSMKAKHIHISKQKPGNSGNGQRSMQQLPYLRS